MVTLNSHHEVADFLDTSQFLPGRSGYECVSYSAALIKFCGEPGKGPSGTAMQASNLAQFNYAKFEGSADVSNKNGMSLEAEYLLLHSIGLPYHPIPLTGNTAHDLPLIKAWLAHGFPLLICGAETGMVDMDLGDTVPYNWPPSGNHAIVASGIAPDGNLLVHDTANIDGNGAVRPGPRRYDIAKLQLVSATAVEVPWLPRVPADFNPLQSSQPQEEKPVTLAIHIPANWHDDGTTLTAPNGVNVVHGFREYVLSHNWNPDNHPLAAEFGTKSLELSNTQLGEGTQQLFLFDMLGWTSKAGVMREYVGKELAATREQARKLYAQVQDIQKQLDDAKKALEAAKAAQPSIDPAKFQEYETQIHALKSAFGAIEAFKAFHE